MVFRRSQIHLGKHMLSLGKYIWFLGEARLTWESKGCLWENTAGPQEENTYCPQAVFS